MELYLSCEILCIIRYQEPSGGSHAPDVIMYYSGSPLYNKETSIGQFKFCLSQMTYFLPFTFSLTLSISLFYTHTRTHTHTPLSLSQVELVRPSSGPIGSIIEIAGISLPNAAYTYDRLYLGDLQCDHINNETNLPYRIHWYWNKRHVQCTVENVIAGGYNASIQFRHSANNRGMSWNDSEAMYMMYDDSLAMYELYPGQYICVCVCVCVGVCVGVSEEV